MSNNRRRRRRTFITESNDDKLNAGMPGFNSMEIIDCQDRFIDALKTRNLSTDTLKFYRQQIRSLILALESQGIPTKVDVITHDIMERNFIAYSLNELGVKYSTVAIRLRGLRAFFNWLVERSIIPESPMKDIVINNKNRNTIETYSREQVRELFRQPDLETFVGYRDYAILTVFIETGVRLRELTDIKVEDVRMADSQILIHGKSGEDRLVPFQRQAERVLKRYLKARGESPVPYLFVTEDDRQMSRKAVQERVAKYGRMSNITNVRNSPHTFRHTFAKMSVQNGANIFDLQKILGHSTLEMVRVYVNMFSGEVAESHRKFSPLENLHR